MSDLKIELLWWRGCPSWERAHALLREEMTEIGLDPDSIEVREIETDDDAGRDGFTGSPTIRINGADIQPPGDAEPPGLTCRVYRTRDGGVSPLPDPEDVRAALGAGSAR